MNAQIAKLIDRSRNVVGIAHVNDEGEHYGGTIDLSCTPASLRALFEDFDEIVNGQMFSVLEEIQNKIDSWQIKALFDNGLEANVRDLQVYPSTGDISFQLASVPASPASNGPIRSPGA
jgi:hypothetical protein